MMQNTNLPYSLNTQREEEYQQWPEAGYLHHGCPCGGSRWDLPVVYVVRKLVVVQRTKAGDLTIARRGDASSSWSLGPEQRRKEMSLPITV